ncbi:MAG TPA: hypothetical protein DCL81_15800, partial [Algoriphagus sp.]|nr:hypothetical protein [Algoriphagus sp.]
MAGSLKKVGIGREDCVYPSDESYPLATWERQGSLGTLTGLTKMPNMWISHKNTINAQYYNSGALTDTTISDACAAIGTTNVRTLYIGPGDWVIEADLDLSSYSNICFEIAPGANLQISNTKTLTINGPFKAGLYQVFSGDGNVKFGGGTVKEVYPEWFGDVDGTADEVQINLAMAAFTNSKGIVRLTKENYTTAATINLGTYIVLKGSGGRNTQITYSGSGSAIAGSQVQHAGVTDLYIQVTHDDGNGIELGDSCRRNHLERLYINNDGDAAVTGAGIYLNNNGATWSGGLNIEDVYVSSFKFGIKWNGASFTSVAAQNVWLVGRSAGVIAGSAGISMDANGDGIGSTFTGGTIESFATGVAIADGANGISIQADFEGNTTPWTLGSSYTGEIAGIGGGTDFERHSSNSTSNKFYVEKQDSGVYTKETYYDQRYVINGSGNRYWGAFTGSTGASYVGGDTVHPSVGFRLTPGGGHTVGADPEQYFMYIKDRRVTFATALPTSDTWAVGSIIWNANINVAGGPS